MPLFSAFTPFGAGFAFSGAPSHAETIYRSMVSNLGVGTDTISTEEGSRMRAFCYAHAMAAARILYTLEHAGYQMEALKLVEMLATREGEYGIIPAATETDDERRATLAARLLAPLGGWLNNIRNALITLLGTSFRQYVPTDVADFAVDPTNCGDQPMLLLGGTRLPKLFSLSANISIGLGSPQWVAYELIDLPAIPRTDDPTLPPENLLVGEEVVVDAGHNVSHERVTISGLREQTPGFLELEATFSKPHGVGAIGTNYDYPYWISTKRHNALILTSLAAADPEIRRRANELLDRMVRAVSTWAIVQEDPLSAGHTGVFLADESGADTQTMGDVAFVP